MVFGVKIAHKSSNVISPLDKREESSLRREAYSERMKLRRKDRWVNVHVSSSDFFSFDFSVL